MALGEIDGDYVSGICFVGFANSAARTGLLLAPLTAAMLVSVYIIIRGGYFKLHFWYFLIVFILGLMVLVKVKIESRDIISVHSSSKIRSNIVRMGVFALFMVVFCVITFVYHGYQTENIDTWNNSLQNFIL